MTAMDAKEAIEKMKAPELPDGSIMVGAEARQEAIKALKKQIPKKPVETEAAFPYNIFTGQKCANCGNPIIGNKIYKYCPECGQKIDWGDGD